VLLDLRGLICPLPALRLRKALSAMRAGETVVAVCTDPLAAIDIPNLVAQTGHELLATAETDEERRFTVRKR
jgi:tRNA 2-thiouridine synthesizing protein A